MNDSMIKSAEADRPISIGVVPASDSTLTTFSHIIDQHMPHARKRRINLSHERQPINYDDLISFQQRHLIECLCVITVSG